MVVPCIQKKQVHIIPTLLQNNFTFFSTYLSPTLLALAVEKFIWNCPRDDSSAVFLSGKYAGVYNTNIIQISNACVREGWENIGRDLSRVVMLKNKKWRLGKVPWLLFYVQKPENSKWPTNSLSEKFSFAWYADFVIGMRYEVNRGHMVTKFHVWPKSLLWHF